eukprot:TRINITY_DN3799_c1_g1_i1.p1 TRINITY_DN3799_c1_g1~~TRINITY_DN3799_c1_g1_i1.p1  ORF type:complete len:202 (+),score=50.31 TRINITY_DN3799_c1_g1_i1:92-607(+)
MAWTRRSLVALLAASAMPWASAGSLRRNARSIASDASADGAVAAGSAAQNQTWWPLDRLSSLYSKAPEKSEQTEPPRPSLQAAKDQVILSSAFGRKIKDLCSQAPREDMATCRHLAADRLFCKLMERHAGRYEGMEGAKEEMQKCREVDTMENPTEAAADVRLQEEAKEAF